MPCVQMRLCQTVPASINAKADVNRPVPVAGPVALFQHADTSHSLAALSWTVIEVITQAGRGLAPGPTPGHLHAAQNYRWSGQHHSSIVVVANAGMRLRISPARRQTCHGQMNFTGEEILSRVGRFCNRRTRPLKNSAIGFRQTEAMQCN